MAVALLGLMATTAGAGVILNPSNSLGSQIDFYEPIGNSFTAEDPAVFAALFLKGVNRDSDPFDPILFALYEGTGTAGALLFSQSLVVDASFSGFFDVDLSSVPLTVGATYSFVASIVGDSPYWGLDASDGPHGQAIRGGTVVNGFIALRVSPTAVTPIPEPSTLVLAGLGGLVLIGVCRARR